jgi:hypothetical protein
VRLSKGVVRQERVETTQLAVDTHGYTDFAMALDPRLLGFDLCPTAASELQAAASVRAARH